MNIVVLTHKPRPIDIDKIFLFLKNHLRADSFEVIDVPVKESKNISPFIKQYNLKKKDLVILDLPFKRLYKQAKQINKLKKVFIYEEDACQNFLNHSKWYGKFDWFYSKLKNASIICTGSHVTSQLNALAHDVRFLPKGFNKDLLGNDNLERTIALGFIGSLRSDVYMERRNALEFMTEKAGLKALHTESFEEYREKLNRMKIFFSADIGMGEYMCKNFEAMACGCVLVAYKQGNGEEEALGLADMENAVLYSSIEEAFEKVNTLLNDSDLCDRIATAGQKHVLANMEFEHLGRQWADIIKGSCNG